MFFYCRNYHQFTHLKFKRRGNNQNKNNNHTSLSTFDVAECLDGHSNFVVGLKIDLAKGTLILNENDAHMVCLNVSMKYLRKMILLKF